MSKITRSALYKKVWNMPMVSLCKEFGISDVALAKVCKKHKIPTPPRGHWARIQNGYKDKKTPLPKGDDLLIEFDIETNIRNREVNRIQREQEKKNLEAVKPVIELAQKVPHPIETCFLRRIENLKADNNGLLKMKRIGLPEVEITEDSVRSVSRFLGVMGYILKEQGVIWSNSGDGLQSLFTRDGFGVGFRISQVLVKNEREPTQEEKRKPSWEWDLTVYKPTEKLTVVLYSAEIISGRKKWSESNNSDIVDLAWKVSARVNDLLRGFEDSRIAAIEREKQWQEQKLINEQNRRKQARLDQIADIKAGRLRELVRASMLWKEHKEVSEFIQQCARQWNNSPTLEQKAWLNWAEEALQELSPFAAGYPNPKKHGPLDEYTIEEESCYCPKEETTVRKTQLLKDIKGITQKRGYDYSSW
jgi:hypothetical protein